ncbi:MAG: acetyl-CoA C-acetyltransferase [Gammaproteobacteria bacterium]|jgi:acetyl-CoA C-acetyltransferase
MTLPKHTPVLVGIGTASRREEKSQDALEPMDLMLEAVSNAGKDSGNTMTLSGAQYIAVPRGRWSYANPAGEIARSVGASLATTVLASVGVLQQTLIGEACARIASGEAHTTLVTGGDAGYRLLRAKIAGQQVSEREQDIAPDIFMAPKEELRHPVEKRAGLVMPVGLYAMMESAFRAKQGWSIAEHRDRMADIGARCSRIAAANPHAWNRQSLDATIIRNAGDRNPMQAFPYTRAHCSTWNVDQAAALLFCSVERAEQLQIPRERWIFPVASTESNHMVAVSARADLATCVGAQVTGEAALEAGGLAAQDVDLVELYSCFPLAIETYAQALGLSVTRDLTVTGGMPFAGGPYNNYVLQATCRAAQLLRLGQGRTALVSSVSGILTKQAFGLLSTEPAPDGFVHADLSTTVARKVGTREVVDEFNGEATIAGYTVLHGRGQSPRGIFLVDTPHGQRALVSSEDAATIAAMQTQEFVGRRVSIANNELMP